MSTRDRPSHSAPADTPQLPEAALAQRAERNAFRADDANWDKVDLTNRPDIDQWDLPPPPLATDERSDDQTVLQGPLLDRIRDLVGLGENREGDHISALVDRPAFPPDRAPEFAKVTIRDDDGSLRQPPLWDGQARREDVRQRGLGDCWLMSPLGAVAGHKPERIGDILRERSDGGFDVTLSKVRLDPVTRDWKPTKGQIVLEVTPELAVDPRQPDRSVFADTAKSGVLWPAIMEKAFAGIDQTWDDKRKDMSGHPQTVTGYHRLDEGGQLEDTAEVLAMLTGKKAGVLEFIPGITRNHDAEQLMKRQLDNDHPVIVGTKNVPAGRALPHDLEPGHAYEVVSIDRGMVTLRNPWGRRHPPPIRVGQLLNNIDQRFATTKD